MPLLESLSKKLNTSSATRRELKGSEAEKREALKSIIQNNHIATIAPKDGGSPMKVVNLLPKNSNYIIGNGYWVDDETIYDETTVFIFIDDQRMEYEVFKKLMMGISIANDQVAYAAKQADKNDRPNQAELIFTGINHSEKTDFKKWEKDLLGTVAYGEKNPDGYTVLNNIIFTFKK